MRIETRCCRTDLRRCRYVVHKSSAQVKAQHRIAAFKNDWRIVMQETVCVDVAESTIAYRPAAGEEHASSVDRMSTAALYHAAPWRTFKWYYGQRHYSGTYWSATMGDHVIYESRLELDNLRLADFDPSVRTIIAQPFQLRAEVNGQLRQHIPDYLLNTDDGPVVVDVIRRERLTEDKIVLLSTWTRIILESLGWGYLIASETPIALRDNVRLLSGYRKGWFLNEDVLTSVRDRIVELDGHSIAKCESLLGEHPKALVRPVLLHLLWCHELHADLTTALRPSTIVTLAR
jgi:hypothetical protein